MGPLVYPRTSEFVKRSPINAQELFEEAKRDKEAFWAKCAHSLEWFEPWHTVLEWNRPYAKWFSGGKLNASYNCLDRHLTSETRDKRAIIWEGERGDERVFTYSELHREVCKLSNVLKTLGVKRNVVVAIYLPLIPEVIVAMLACARIGAVHTVVFGGFSSDALKDRLLDADVKVVITADGGNRRGSVIRLKEAADQAASDAACVHKMIVVKHAGIPVQMIEGRDYYYHELMENASPECPAVHMEAEERLFILYTSGTTGQPKGIVHTTGGYMVGATTTTAWVFDVQPTDIYWCTADAGWITGHSYVVYGPLSNGMTQVVYEGAPDYPTKDRFWKLIEKYGVTTFYTAPTAIRTFMKWGEEWPQKCNLSSLRLLGTVGEPINPEAWIWFYKHIGSSKCPIVDTWWQTETGSIMISALPAHTPLKPGSATFPLPGIEVAILDESGKECATGDLAILEPWPSMLRGIHNDPERYEKTYWQKWGGRYYFTGDGATRDDDGYYWLMGRVDDVMNIAGHRLGTMELESALVDHPTVAEAAVIAVPHPIKGQAICAFVTLKDGVTVQENHHETLKDHVAKKIGKFARPERIIFTHDLPKTRSGKIMRRLLRAIAEGTLPGDLSTLADPSIIQDLKTKYPEE